MPSGKHLTPAARAKLRGRIKELLAEGLTDRLIAERLGVSFGVITKIGRVLRKEAQ